MVTRHEVPKVQIRLELKWSRGMMFGWSREAKVKTTATQKLNSDLFWDDKSVMTLSFRPSRALRASRAPNPWAHTGRGPAGPGTRWTIAAMWSMLSSDRMFLFEINLVVEWRCLSWRIIKVWPSCDKKVRLQCAHGESNTMSNQTTNDDFDQLWIRGWKKLSEDQPGQGQLAEQ